MQVIRTSTIETKDFQIGDRISIELNGFGVFTATVHKITDEGALIIFDEYVTSRPMNDDRTNEGGFEKSDLKKWMNTTLLPAFPENLQSHIRELSIPSVGEMFGHDDEWDERTFEADSDEQLPLMKKRCNRVAYLKDNWKWGWLRNATKKVVSSAGFAGVDCDGDPNYYGASGSGGVRPEFWLVR